MLGSESSLAPVGLMSQAWPFDPRMHFLVRKRGGAVGPIATHLESIFGYSEPHVLSTARRFSEHRSGNLDVQEKPPQHVGMDQYQANDFSALSPQQGFTGGLRPVPTTRDLWAARQHMSAFEEIKERQRNLEEPCWLATVSRPDLCVLPARIAAPVFSRKSGDDYRIDDFVKTDDRQRFRNTPPALTPFRQDAAISMDEWGLAGEKCIAAHCLSYDGRAPSIEISLLRKNAV